MNPTFYFDTADSEYIKKVWYDRRVKDYMNAEWVRGVTTNPNALSKVNAYSLNDFERVVIELANTLYDIRGDSLGEIHVQFPSSTGTMDEFKKWVNYCVKLNESLNTTLKIKIPPRLDILHTTSLLDDVPLKFNVTGLSDAASCFMALSHRWVEYVSIIPGRMEEVGIPADYHLKMLSARWIEEDKHVIAGSMRTLEGLADAVFYHTIPTIGYRVWDAMDEKYIEHFEALWLMTLRDIAHRERLVPPETTEINTKLSNDFFKQMDELGAQLYKDLFGV